MIYRPEIDGLRAVAVLPVILFHAGVAAMPGGFIGVDVFFVISGYLITSILIAEISTGRFRLRNFYERRARRILPALVFVLLCCVPMAWAWMLPQALKEFSQGLISVALSASNILFWWKTDYFAADAARNPLLHTWSLAVEEQFYIVFPLLLLVLWRSGRAGAFRAVLGLSVASLLLSEVASRLAPATNFYLLPTRAWELGAGALCAFLLERRELRGSALWSGLGLAMILTSVFVFDEGTRFPSAYALLPVGGAMLVILQAGPGTPVARLLSTRLFTGIGLVSYSAYLWHQPLFAFARLRSLSDPSPLAMAGLTGLTFALAWISWRFVERPFRERPFRLLPTQGAVFAASGVALAALVLVGVHGQMTDGRTGPWLRAHPESAGLLAFTRYPETPDYALQFTERGCFLSGKSQSLDAFRVDRCLQIDPKRRNYLLIGDSHAAHLARALAEAYPGVNLMQATSSGCKPAWEPRGEATCTALYGRVFAFLSDHRDRIDGVILSARWTPRDVLGLRITLDHLKTEGIPAAVLGPTAEYGADLPELLIHLAARGPLEPANRLSRPEIRETDRLIGAAVTGAGAGYVSVLQALCPGGPCRSFSDTGEPMQFDYGHFTLSGARSLVAAGLPRRIEALFPPATLARSG